MSRQVERTNYLCEFDGLCHAGPGEAEAGERTTEKWLLYRVNQLASFCQTHLESRFLLKFVLIEILGDKITSTVT